MAAPPGASSPDRSEAYQLATPQNPVSAPATPVAPAVTPETVVPSQYPGVSQSELETAKTLQQNQYRAVEVARAAGSDPNPVPALAEYVMYVKGVKEPNLFCNAVSASGCTTSLWL